MKSILAFLALLTVFSVRSEYLYWMVGNQVGEVSISGDDYAYLCASNSNNPIGDQFYYRSGLNGIYGVTDISSYVNDTSTKLYINVYHDEELIYSGMDNNAFTIAQLSQYIRDDMAAATSARGTVYWNAIPEPVGGVLVLVGLAVLGLRRRVERAS